MWITVFAMTDCYFYRLRRYGHCHRVARFRRRLHICGIIELSGAARPYRRRGGLFLGGPNHSRSTKKVDQQ